MFVAVGIVLFWGRLRGHRVGRTTAVLGADADEPEGSDLVSAETLALYAQLLRAQTGVGIESVASSAAGG